MPLSMETVPVSGRHTVEAVVPTKAQAPACILQLPIPCNASQVIVGIPSALLNHWWGRLASGCRPAKTNTTSSPQAFTAQGNECIGGLVGGQEGSSSSCYYQCMLPYHDLWPCRTDSGVFGYDGYRSGGGGTTPGNRLRFQASSSFTIPITPI